MTTINSVLNQRSAAARHVSSLGWSLLLVAPVIVCTVVAMLASAFVPPLYAARADIIFQMPQEGAATEEYRATQTVIATSQAVLGPVAESRGTSIEAISSGLEVTFPLSGAVMRLQYSDTDQSRALDVLTAIFDRYNAVLGGIEALDQGTHRLLVPPHLLGRPVHATPLQLMAIGLVVGLAISLSAFALIKRPRE